MGWFIVFIMVITTTGNFWFTSQLSRSEHRHQAAENTQQAPGSAFPDGKARLVKLCTERNRIT